MNSSPSAGQSPRVSSLVLDASALLALLQGEPGVERPITRPARLSLGDRACLALARTRRIPALTADQAWDAVRVGAEVRVIR